MHLVASAVEGLEPNHITVVDTSGRILSKRNDSSIIGQMTTNQLEYQRNLEEGYKRKIQGMLEEVLGLNKAIARVSAEIDFQQIDITEERFDPSSVVRSEQKNTERSSMNSGTRARGIQIRETGRDAASQGKSSCASGSPPKTRCPNIGAVPEQSVGAAERNSQF